MGPFKEGTTPCDPTLASVDFKGPKTSSKVSEEVSLALLSEPDLTVGSELCGPSPGLVTVVYPGKGPTVACKVGKPLFEITGELHDSEHGMVSAETEIDVA